MNECLYNYAYIHVLENQHIFTYHVMQMKKKIIDRLWSWAPERPNKEHWQRSEGKHSCIDTKQKPAG
jgi:hypothetical protein